MKRTIREEYIEYPMSLHFGPSHPATHGTLHMIVRLDGEKVIDIEPDAGFLHTGFEKLGEHHSYNQFIAVTDRANYLSSFNNNLGLALAVEHILGIDVPPRGQAIRRIMAEFSRIHDHVVVVGLMGLDTNAWEPLMLAFIEREKIYDLFHLICGSRLTTTYTRVGGMTYDLPPAFFKMALETLHSNRSTLQKIEALLTNNRIFIDRMRNVASITSEDAVNWGLTGSLLRAAGVNYDIRKIRPYCGYEDMDFDVPVYDDGDNYSRYVIRIDEMYQSMRIIEQTMKYLPSGPIDFFNNKIRLPEKNNVYTKMESLIHHFKIIMDHHQVKIPVGEYYHSTEASNGELGFHIVSDGEGHAYRMRIRPPSFLHYQVVKKLLKGRMLADIPATLSTLNVIAGELDR